MRLSWRAVMLASVMATAGACDDAALPDPAARAAGRDGQVLTGWITTSRGKVVEVSYEVVGGDAILEGDINLGPVSSVARTRKELLARRAVEGGPRYGSIVDYRGAGLWPYGQVPYIISGSFNATQRQTIINAMAHVSGTTGGTSFSPRTTQSSYLRFELSGSVCNSPAGYRGGVQTINLTGDCAYSGGTVAHEILHTLGMWHEQSRCDRDNYVTINYANIPDDKEHNFARRCPSSGWWWDEGGRDFLEYNEGSIMHYDDIAFSSNGQPTITSLRGRAGEMGQSTVLAQTDISTINHLYQPYQVQGFSLTYPGGTPTLSWQAYGKGVLGYAVNLVVVYEEYDDYNGTSTIYDHSVDGVGTTTGTSLQDTQRSYTGYDRCNLYYSINGSAWYAYYYEVTAGFPDGIGSQPLRWPAAVAPQYC